MDKIKLWFEQNRTLAIILAVVAVFFLNKGKKTDPKLEPDRELVQISFDQTNTRETLARWVENEHVEDTDYLIKMAEKMKEKKALEDLSFLNDYFSKNVAINASNKAEIAAKIRGGR